MKLLNSFLLASATAGTCEISPGGQGCSGGPKWEPTFLRKISGQTTDTCKDLCLEDEKCSEFIIAGTACYLFSGECDRKKAGSKYYKCSKEETPAEQTCPENMPFNFQDSYMCCALQPDAEGNCPDGAEGSDCTTHHPDTGIYTCADHPTAVRKEVWTCPENHPFIYEDGTMCCAEQPVDEMTCNADNSGCPPRIPSLLCSDHPTAVRVEVGESDSAKVCPEDMPFVYTYIDDYDSCCSKEVNENGNCVGMTDYCDHDPPCESHPSAISDEDDNDEEVETDDGKVKVCDHLADPIKAKQWCNYMYIGDYWETSLNHEEVEVQSVEECARACQEHTECMFYEVNNMEGQVECHLHQTECPDALLYDDEAFNWHACEMRKPEEEDLEDAEADDGKVKVCNTKNVIHTNQWCQYMDIEDYEDIMTVISATFAGCAKACQESDDCIIWEFDVAGAVDGEGQCMLWSVECPGDLLVTGGGWNRHACEMQDPQEETPAEQTCPENMPFNFQDSYMCCAVQPDAEGNCPGEAEGSDCTTHHPDTGVYTCADHPTAVRNQESSENEVVEFSTEPTCPECWQLNASKTACVIIPNSGCCEMSCDAAKMTFSFLPKMMDQDDLSHDFGVTGLSGNTGSGKYQYSHGFGTTGQVVTVDGDEMVFTVKITTEASEERMIKDVDVGGTTLILESGKKEIEALEVEFSCRVPLVTEVESDVFTVTDDNEVKSQTLGGEKAVSLVADLKPTFSISLFKDAGSSEAITSSNLKLGEVIYFSLKWSNSENDQVQYFANDCKIVDGATEVAIISETCLAGVVETTRLGARHHKTDLQYSYKSFAVDSMAVGSSRTQTIKCSLKLCLNADCHSNMKNYDSQCPRTTGFMYTKA